MATTRMDPDYTYCGVPAPDLGAGTVVATKGGELMEGWYVQVEWDEYHGSRVEQPAIGALVHEEESCH